VTNLAGECARRLLVRFRVEERVQTFHGFYRMLGAENGGEVLVELSSALFKEVLLQILEEGFAGETQAAQVASLEVGKNRCKDPPAKVNATGKNSVVTKAISS